jgi:hypothetical protein
MAEDNKAKIIAALKILMDLIESDQIHVDEIKDLTAGEIIARAELEAAKAVEGSDRLQNLPND